MNDKRIIGTWKIDVPKTLKGYRNVVTYRNLSLKEKRLLNFGIHDCQIKITNKYITMQLNNVIEKSKYKVIGKNTDQTIIEYYDVDSLKNKFFTIHHEVSRKINYIYVQHLNYIYWYRKKL